jgi:hypothetical protein
MGRGLGVTLIALAIGGLLAVGATAHGTNDGVPAPSSFRLGDGSAGCVFDGTTLACRGAATSSTVVLDSEGRTRSSRQRVEWNTSTPVLRLTESWFNGVYSCAVDSTTIVCSSVDGGQLAVGGTRIAGGHAASTLP